jgi:hypothetical protein
VELTIILLHVCCWYSSWDAACIGLLVRRLPNQAARWYNLCCGTQEAVCAGRSPDFIFIA